MQTVGSRLPALLRHKHVALSFRAFSSEAAARPEATYEVPAGHQSSDLGNVACNVSLSRRRDLTLRQDLHVHENGKKATVADVLKGKLVALFGVPDMGKVCTDQHFPDFLKNADRLKAAGIDKIACSAVASTAQMEAWAKKAGDPSGQISLIADEDGGLTRMLGLELPATSSGGPRSQRYAAIIDDGILLKLRVENHLADVKTATAEGLLQIIEEQRLNK